MNEIDAQKSAAVNRNNGKQTHHGKYIKQTTKTGTKKKAPKQIKNGIVIEFGWRISCSHIYISVYLTDLNVNL